MSKKYFISYWYSWVGKIGHDGFGNTAIEMQRPISEKDIKDIEEGIKAQNTLRSISGTKRPFKVKIVNIVELENVEN